MEGKWKRGSVKSAWYKHISVEGTSRTEKNPETYKNPIINGGDF